MQNVVATVSLRSHFLTLKAGSLLLAGCRYLRIRSRHFFRNIIILLEKEMGWASRIFDIGRESNELLCIPVASLRKVLDRGSSEYMLLGESDLLKSSEIAHVMKHGKRFVSNF